MPGATGNVKGRAAGWPLGVIKEIRMKVLNVHERGLQATPDRVGALIDSLASTDDMLWPKHSWPRMKFDGPLGIGARGGHGPIRYVVDAYTPQQSIRFRFTAPAGFEGTHGYEVIVASSRAVVLRHTLEMRATGPALLSWPLIFRPLHDALIEDSLATAEVSLGASPSVQPWSSWVKFLRWMVSGGRARR